MAASLGVSQQALNKVQNGHASLSADKALRFKSTSLDKSYPFGYKIK
jgi:plasmid maintenance system antidote protein VapI